MTFRTLTRRSLRFHWRSHLGVVLGAAIGSAALIGALVVGDSVKGSLKDQALKRLAGASLVLNSGDRFFQADLLDRMKQAGLQNRGANLKSGNPSWGHENPISRYRTLLMLPASISRFDSEARANNIRLIGLDYSELRLLQSQNVIQPTTTGTVASIESGAWINAALARQLAVNPGDSLLLRIRKPSALSPDATIGTRNDETVALRLNVEGVTGSMLADFQLNVANRPPLNVFVSRRTLEAVVALTNRANVMLLNDAVSYRVLNRWERFYNQNRIYGALGGRTNINLPKGFTVANPLANFDWWTNANSFHPVPLGADTSAKLFEHLLRGELTLNDLQQDWVLRSRPNRVELRTARVFLDPPIVRAALTADTNAEPTLTYLVNLIRAETNSTPYSMVTAAGAPWTTTDLREDEIVVSQWLAEDLQVKPGDELALVYFDPESGARLVEHTNTYRVHSIVPMEMPWADRTLMPDFPGIEKAESTSEWDAGFPLTYKVREKDDDYWKQHRGTPKAFITLAAGQKMWGNRFGNVTSIRFPVPDDVTTAFAYYREPLEKRILANLKPEELGLRFEPVREQALKAAEESQDFGGLFLGFSFFVIAAALLLMALLFSLGLEQRAPEIGTLLALGFTPGQVRKLLLREAVVLSLIGGVIGAVGGLVYARAMLHGLTTIWRDAVGASALSFHFTVQTLVIGIFASAIVSVVTIWLTLRKFVKRPARELLVGEIGADESKVRSLKSKIVTVLALLAGVGLAGWAVVAGDTANAGIFFGAGALILVAGLSFSSGWLTRLGGASLSERARTNDNHQHAGSETGAPITMGSLAVRGCARRRKRSLATVAMLACGSFLIVSIGVFRLDANRDATKKTSGTGGFALIGETTMPVVHDLNTASGRDFFALNDRDLEGVNIVPFRVREGDEASCLNLNRAQKPRLLGVKPEMLEGRFGFKKGDGWKVLHEDGRWKLEDGKPDQTFGSNSPSSIVHPPSSLPVIPAIGDANSIQWAMGKKVGDTLDYVDERGQPFKVRIVGAVANSILQGQLIIDEAEFVKRFPGESGYRMFLLEAPSNAVSQVSAILSRAMQDVGLELTPAPQRLAQFNAVQNTYLGTFQVLGGLGLLLGSVGLGIVVLRNVLERRGELALLIAVGFRKQQLQRLLLLENGVLLAAGLALGVVAAAVAVLPALLSPGAELPYATLTLTLAGVLANGALWTWTATLFAVRGDLLKALRNE